MEFQTPLRRGIMPPLQDSELKRRAASHASVVGKKALAFPVDAVTGEPTGLASNEGDFSAIG
jgi:hypothetical protein